MRLILGALALLLTLTAPAFARGPGWVLSMPVFGDDGDNRVPFKVDVGSMAAISIYTPDVSKDRAVAVYNPSPNYSLMLGTSSNFRALDLYWVVPKDSGTFVSSNHSPLFAAYEVNAPSETVRGVVEKQ